MLVHHFLGVVVLSICCSSLPLMHRMQHDDMSLLQVFVRRSNAELFTDIDDDVYEYEHDDFQDEGNDSNIEEEDYNYFQEENEKEDDYKKIVEEDDEEDVMALRKDKSAERKDAIRKAVLHAWENYKKFAWGKDDLRPMSHGGEDNLGQAVTMVDSLDTLWLVGLKEEFNEAKEWLEENLPDRLSHIPPAASVFETCIRTLGGLLSAYDLSHDKVFIDLAIPLARKIMGAVSDEGVTTYRFDGGDGGMGCPSLTDSGTLQLEMRYLSFVTGDASFAAKVNNFYETVKKHPSMDGLWPNCWERGSGKITFGADGDSFYEYLLKVWLQGGREDASLWKMYDEAATGLEKHLIRVGDDDRTYLQNVDWTRGDETEDDMTMDHLTCFVPGWLAMGAQYQQDEHRKRTHMQLAADIAKTCYDFYSQQPTGIGPERVKQMQIDLSRTDTREYILRPEAAEGWFYMHEITGEHQYREWGWTVFQSMEKMLRVPNGYASLKDVRSPKSQHMDRMESFWIAETLKYLYLLQDDDHIIPLDKYVFNTEAHPLRVLAHADKVT
eukprot:gnl/TRDRNA2_/TRDRNA2_170124_c0_seq7.p1 gnl/TRDRNA2_/TRDRNA2_170124_c0~~gnl/TRDRNA2_/TRDRNA2_170124_c0_seq7.p1  ORF type:complete len:552 (-),score=112.35 gnl/TRDRNA2_/TRDRNA2_170124_c0_seq7:14-1669(-)